MPELAELFVTISAKAPELERVAARCQREIKAIEMQAELLGKTQGFDEAAKRAKQFEKTITFMSRKNPAELAKVSGEMKQLVAETRRLEQQSKQAARGQQILASAASKARIALAAGAAATGAAAIAAGRTGIQAYAAREQRDIAFTGLFGGDRGASQQALDTLQQIARTSPFEFDPLASMTQRFMGVGIDWQDMPKIITSIGDAAARTGKGGEAVDRISNALIQMLQKGKVSSEEMTQQLGELIPAWQILADEMGTTVPIVQKMVEDGLVPADKAFRALIIGMERWAPGAMADQVGTLNTKWSGFMDTLKGERGVLSDIGGLLVDTFDIKDYLDDATDSLINLQDAIDNGAGWDAIFPPWLRDILVGSGVGAAAYGISSLTASIQAMTVAAGGAGILATVGTAAPFLPWIVGATAAAVSIGAVVSAMEDTDKAAKNIITGTNGVSPWSVGPIASVGPQKPKSSTGMGELRAAEAPASSRMGDFRHAEDAAKAAAAAVEKAWRDAQRNIAVGSQNTSSKLAVDSLRATVIITNQIPARWAALKSTYADVAQTVKDNPMEIAVKDEEAQAALKDWQLKLDTSPLSLDIDTRRFVYGLTSLEEMFKNETDKFQLTLNNTQQVYELTVGAIEMESQRLVASTQESWQLAANGMVQPMQEAADELYMHSIVPDMVKAIVAWMKRLEKDVVPPAQKMADAVVKAAREAQEKGVPAYEAVSQVLSQQAANSANAAAASLDSLGRGMIDSLGAVGDLWLATNGYADALANAVALQAAGKQNTVDYAYAVAAAAAAQRNMQQEAYALSSTFVDWLGKVREAHGGVVELQGVLTALQQYGFNETSAAIQVLTSEQMKLDSLWNSAKGFIKQYTLDFLTAAEKRIIAIKLETAATALLTGNWALAGKAALEAAETAAIFETLKNAVNNSIVVTNISAEAEALKQLTDELAAIDKIEAARGASYDELREKANAYRRALEALARAGSSQQVIDEVAGKLKAVEDQMAARGNVPAMASGGIVRASAGGTIVRLGEGGVDEAVVPLSGGRRGGMAGGEPMVQVVITGNTIMSDRDVDRFGELIVSRLRRSGVRM